MAMETGVRTLVDKIRLRCTSPRGTDLSRASLPWTCSIARSLAAELDLELDPPDWIDGPVFQWNQRKLPAPVRSLPHGDGLELAKAQQVA